MADTEKLMALKKAYADIILNTAKEAAARIMVSERKAQRYQRELFAAKDESLGMLLRLKQMLDSKVNEAEMTSFSQQRRIEELEAQLGEAEDIVKDLRAELRELQDELEKVTSNQMKPLSERNSVVESTTLTTAMEENGPSGCNSEGGNATALTVLEENGLSTSGSGSALSTLPPPQCNLVITLESKNSNVIRACNGNKCYGQSDCHKENCFVCHHDFASIVMRSKEPELYRNGCTQRVRAFERKLLGENISLSEQSDGVKNQIFIGEEEDGKDLCKQLVARGVEVVNGIRKRRKRNSPLSVQGGDMKKQISIKEEDKHKCKNSSAKANVSFDVKRSPSLVVVKNDEGIPRAIRRKRAATHRRNREYKNFPTFPRQAVDNNVQTKEDSATIGNISEEDPEPFVVPKSPSNTLEVITQLGSEDIIKQEAEFGRRSSFQNVPSGDKLSMDELGLTGQDAVSALSSEFPACKSEFEVASELLSNSGLKELGANETVPTQLVDNKFLKYTFQRKRKREMPSSPDSDSFLENSTLRRKMEEKQSGESHISGVITESSRDNRRLAQVARQLISLSEKKWR